MPSVTPQSVPFIYNLFPPLAGDASTWASHAKRAADMDFNWLFVNPLQFPGESGSLYSIREHNRLNPLFFPQETPEEQFAALEKMISEVRACGLEVMFDLVINHTAHDSPLIQEHPQWYKWLEDGTIAHPGALDNGHWVIWGDLAEIDNENSSDKSGLYSYWWDMIKKMLDLGVRGFRCDAAYKVPRDLWRLLIGRAKEQAPDACFFAETLGCPFEDNLALTEAGFDFTFNSGKWWNYKESWFLDQLRDGCGRTRSICFPESHDTDRLMEEYREEIGRVKQHYAFTALISSGVMIVSGFEFGFKKRCHVVHSKPEDWENTGVDLTDYIRRINNIKDSYKVFQEDNHVERVDIGTDNIIALKKTSLDNSERALILLNMYGQKHGASQDRMRQIEGFGNLNVLCGQVSIGDGEVAMEPWGLAVITG